MHGPPAPAAARCPAAPARPIQRPARSITDGDASPRHPRPARLRALPIHPSPRADNNALYTYITGGTCNGQMSMSAQYRLPAGVSCPNGCVLQWEFLTMNSCFERCDRAVCGPYADRVNPVCGFSNMADCWSNVAGVDTVPEVFRNCADIAITGGGGAPLPSPSPPMPVPSPPMPQPSPPPPSPPPTGTCPLSATAICAANPGRTHIADPCDTSCARFVMCSNGVGTFQTCPAGTRFSTTALVCDWAANVKCPR